jgi:4-hydroxy-2-oxoheptanedioate aldolase
VTRPPSRPTTSLRQRLIDGPPLLGTFSVIASTEVVELAGLAGFDVVILDMEHGAYEIAGLGPHILAARARDIAPIVRVRWNEPALIGAALDAGAAGVLVPHVQSAADAAAVVAAARFPPLGGRGAHPWVRAADYAAAPDWHARANTDVAVIAMVEGREGVAAVDEILATPGLDAVFLGPVDLAASLGLAGQLDHPDVIAAVRSVVERAAAVDVAAACFSPSVEGARRWLDAGARLVTVGVDTQILLPAFRALVDGVRADGIPSTRRT